MKRLPLATLLGVLFFALLATFTQHRAVADHTQSNQQTDQIRSNRTILNDNGTITTLSDETGKGEFVPGEMLVKFRNERDGVDSGRGMKNARGHLKMSNPRMNEIFARFQVNNGSRPFARARAKSLAKVVKLTTQSGNLKEALAALREQPCSVSAAASSFKAISTTPSVATLISFFTRP